MMIRSNRIPPVLNRICGNGIETAILVTADGELLGTSSSAIYYNNNKKKAAGLLLADQATLITDICSDYGRMGQELRQRQLNFVSFELDQGTVGVASAGPDCFVIAIATTNVAPGLLKARLTACAGYVQEAFTPLVEPA
jgi:predicted regulator of Ras-like GTPase activity (Roadblock/LC7/MglB family)